MRHVSFVNRVRVGVLVVLSICGVTSAARAQTGEPAGKMPITTASPEARKLYTDGRDLAEKLRATDAQQQFERAVQQDPNFALAHLGLAQSSGTAKQFFDSLTRAASLASGASEGERHLILGVEAGARGNPAEQERHFMELVRLFPNDERAHNQLGGMYFGRQDYQSAVKHYLKATAINPSFSAPYNQLGYAHRFLENFADAEKAFQKYIELIPNDPNPHDSYAELLMKMGRFEESIKHYEKALSIDPNFVASYVGIGHNQLFMGDPEKARATFAKIASVARTTGEKRLANLWTAATYVHEGATDKALAEIRKGTSLSEADQDWATISGDLNQIGDILREAGRYDQAATSYAESLAAMNKATVPEDVKAGTRRNHLFEEGRMAAAKNDLATAKAKLSEYTTQVAVKKVPFEVRQQHELAGLIALAEKQYAAAAQELKQSNQQDPRVMYLTAVALQGAGDAQQARAMAEKAAKFNSLNFSYGYVRSKAQKLAGS